MYEEVCQNVGLCQGDHILVTENIITYLNDTRILKAYLRVSIYI